MADVNVAGPAVALHTEHLFELLRVRHTKTGISDDLRVNLTVLSNHDERPTWQATNSQFIKHNWLVRISKNVANLAINVGNQKLPDNTNRNHRQQQSH